MRIQHNISAMNAYRNFSGNTSRLSKNLEKLSTGYKINRAGDDAAGLAISEKMRAQISGLDGATKNAKDGISLIQTAEGALTEVHDMLNRMTTLAEQSANGTYDDKVDRNQLQKEVDALKTEIDRIADSTNYNGIKLLDGSLSGASSVKGDITLENSEATKTATSTSAFLTAGSNQIASNEDEVTYSVKWTENGEEKSQTLKFKVTYDSTAKTFNLVAEDGTKYALDSKTSTGGATVSESDTISMDGGKVASAIEAEFKKNTALNNAFKITNAGNSFSFESKTAGTGGAKMKNIDAAITYQGTTVPSGKSVNSTDNLGASEISNTTAGVDTAQLLNLKNIKVLDGSDTGYTGRTLKEIVDINTFEIDGKKFALFSSTNASNITKLKEAAGPDVNFIQLGGANSVAANAGYTEGTTEMTNGVPDHVSNEEDAKTIASELSRVTGRSFSALNVQTNGEPDMVGFSGNWRIALTGGDKLSRDGKSLDLQIGDTADKFNKLSVSVEDMHSNSIGIGDVDISTQEGAAKALDQIKDAVNYVSNTRGTLGALQNRLDHTINNLGVMKENITSAESLIRDTDVAEEMMTYTKNNILNQSAQAMLAQANQLPQGVLQLLG